MKPYRRAAASLSIVVLTSAAALLLWVLWSLLWPFDPLWVSPEGFMPTKTHYRRGEEVQVKVTYCHRLDARARMDTTLEQDDGWLIFMAPKWPTPKVGCHTIKFPVMTIPLALENVPTTRPARVRITFTFRINKLRTVHYNFVTAPFMID